MSNTLINHGTIGGVTYSPGGYVHNFGTISGSLSGSTYGIQIGGASGTVVNAGYVYGKFYGIHLQDGGTVTNLSGGKISGYYGIQISGASGTVVNAGTIIGTGLSDAVFLGNGGAVTNLSGGTLAGAIGVYLSNGGVVTNQSGATIGGVRGASGGFSTVVNAGTINGVDLSAGSVVTNQRGGTISGVNNVSTVVNAGIISGGVAVIGTSSGGTVVNTGTITGPSWGVISSDAVSVVNAGLIRGFDYGARLGHYNFCTNQSGGTISAKKIGINGGFGDTVVNAGTIEARGSGPGVFGVELQINCALTNQSSGTIIGGVFMNSSTAVNAGTIFSSGVYGAYFVAGTLINQSGGDISGGTYGITMNDYSGTITNAGTIAGGVDAVQFRGRNTDRLVIVPGARFIGAVVGNGAHSTLELAAGTNTAITALQGLGSQFIGFNDVVVDAGAKWRLAGTSSLGSGTSLTVNGLLQVTGHFTDQGAIGLNGTLHATGAAKLTAEGGLIMSGGACLATSWCGSIEIGSAGKVAPGRVTVDAGNRLVGAGSVRSATVDNGTVTAMGGTLTFAVCSLSGSGVAQIDAHSVLSVDGAMKVKSLSFVSGGSETAVFGSPFRVSSTISGFAASDSIDLRAFTVTGLSFANHVLTVEEKGGSAARLHFAGSYNTSNFVFGTDHHGGTNITFA